ncbi:6-hydroxy-D-nicotine oxidase [Gracilaria domingensis]|nr:6-hydroxy-D-nicotine oxidase [Gracilaria domingensis]
MPHRIPRSTSPGGRARHREHGQHVVVPVTDVHAVSGARQRPRAPPPRVRRRRRPRVRAGQPALCRAQAPVVPLQSRKPARDRHRRQRVAGVQGGALRAQRGAARVRALRRAFADWPQPVQRRGHRSGADERRVHAAGQRRARAARRQHGRGAVGVAQEAPLDGGRRVPVGGLCGLRAGRRPRAV